MIVYQINAQYNVRYNDVVVLNMVWYIVITPCKISCTHSLTPCSTMYNLMSLFKCIFYHFQSPLFSFITKYISSILVVGRLSSPVSSINKSDQHDLTEMFLKLTLNSIALNLFLLLVLIHWSSLKDTKVPFMKFYISSPQYYQHYVNFQSQGTIQLR